MPVFEIQINGKTQEVEAPDLKSAAQAVQQHAVKQHPWNRFNDAARAGRMPVEGQNYPDNGPGSSYLPTKIENAKELATLAATIGVGPLAQAAAPAYPILAPAVARTGVSGIPDFLTGDFGEGAKKMGATAGMETLMSVLGLPGRFWSAYKAKGVPQPMVHQKAEFQPAPKLYGPSGDLISAKQDPITFQRPTGGALTVQPPAGGKGVDAILQEPMTKAAPGDVGQGVRTAADVYAGENPDQTLGALAAVFNKVKGLNPFRSENPYSSGPRY